MTRRRASVFLAVVTAAITAAAMTQPALGRTRVASVHCNGPAPFLDVHGHPFAYARLRLFPNASKTKALVRLQRRNKLGTTWYCEQVHKTT